LVDRAWDQTGYVALGTKHLREGVGEGRGGLDGREMDFTDGVSVVGGLISV
jgi:hypothetical protein